MTLSMAPQGTRVNILKVTGKEETKKFLSNLGFIEGTTVQVVSEIDGNMIVNIRDSRIAISKSMSNRIIVAEG